MRRRGPSAEPGKGITLDTIIPRLNPTALASPRPDNDGIKRLVFGLLVIAAHPAALLLGRLPSWLLLGVEFPLNAAEFLLGVACHALILASAFAVGKGCLGRPY